MKIFGIAFIGLVGVGFGNLAPRLTGDDWSKSDRISARFAKGYVSKPETAIAIARAIINDLGWKSLTKTPLKAKKYEGFWLVFGPGPTSNNGLPTPGGRLEIEIEEHSGCILRFEQSQ